MTRNAFVMLAVLVMFVAAAQGQEPDRLRAVDYLGESGGALLGGSLVGAGATVALGLVGFALTYSPRSISDFNGWGGYLGALAGAALGYPAGCGLGTTMAGGALHVEGNTGGAYGGAFLGMGLGALGFFAPRAEVGLAAMGVLAPAGAVIGYTIGATREWQGPSFGSRVLPPAVGFSMRSGPDRQAFAVVDCRLFMLRI